MRAAWCMALALAACHPAAEDSSTTRIVIASEPVSNEAPPASDATLSAAAAAPATPAEPPSSDVEVQAKDLYERGETAYNLGDYAKAIEAFKAGYEVWPRPPFLFNIAQSYRQQGDAQNAIFFFKRFLEADPDTKARAEVEDFIRALDGVN
jgi:tetratricopeptide (TPR) repeat protein